MSNVIDLAVIAQLKELMMDDFGLLINTFITDTENKLAALDDAIVREDFEAIRSLAHGLKGSSLNLSAMQMSEHCAAIESMGKERKGELIPQLMQVLKQDSQQVIEALQSL